MGPTVRCRYCDREVEAFDWEDEAATACEVELLRENGCCFCGQLHHDGHEARRRMLPMEECPWERGRRDVVQVFGDPDYHGVGALRCPWCAGWAAAERELYERLKGGAR